MSEKIENLLTSMSELYSMKRRKAEIQFIIDGNKYYFVLTPEHCLLKKGATDRSIYTIETSYDCLKQISGGYLSAVKAILKGDLKVKGSLIKFITGFKNTFSGNNEPIIPDYCTCYPQSGYDSDKIKQVVAIGCSPRERGATNFILSRLISGMEAAGAEVKLFQVAGMKLAACLGCFFCWENGKCCHNDAMSELLESFQQADLVVWATPIYFYNCSTLMKVVIDRFFVGVDSHFMIDDRGKQTHPRKIKFPPYQFIMTATGYQDSTMSKPLIDSLKRLPVMKLIGTINRGMAPALIEDTFKHIKKDQVIEALEIAGRELIEKKKLSIKTKRRAEQPMMEDKKFHAIVNSRAKKNLKRNE